MVEMVEHNTMFLFSSLLIQMLKHAQNYLFLFIKWNFHDGKKYLVIKNDRYKCVLTMSPETMSKILNRPLKIFSSLNTDFLI